MFLQWIAKCELVTPTPESHVLKKFPGKCQQGMASMVVNSLTADGVDIADLLPTAHHVHWAMEAIGQSFALSMDDGDVIFGAVRIYEQWLGLDSTSSKDKDRRPQSMLKSEQTFIQDMVGHMTMLFEERSGSSSPSDAHSAKHISLCTRVLDLLDALIKRRGQQLSPQTWDRLTRYLLGSADSVLHGSRGTLGYQLCGQLMRLVFETYLRSLPVCGPKGDLWSLFSKFSRRWIHRLPVVEQWNAVTVAFTRSMMKQLRSPSPTSEVEITWADNRMQSSIEMESQLLAYAWYRLLRVIGHPTAIHDPDVYYTAIKGITRLADEFTHMDRQSNVDWENVLGALDSSETRGNSTLYFDKTSEISVNNSSVMAEQPRAPPDVNSILRLLGPWLFDACLVRRDKYAAGRSEALRCLGKLLTKYSGSRTKQVNWSYSLRALMALQSALDDNDERIVASAVYNWWRVLGLFGGHTLRGAGVVSTSLHRAIDRLLKAGERRDPTSNLQQKASEGTRRVAEAFYNSDEFHIGGIPIVLLRRAGLKACASLLSLHAHVPKQMMKDAEKELTPINMSDVSGIVSTMPKYTSSNVVGMLSAALKGESDPTNQQLIMWLLTIAIEQEASLWSTGLSSSSNSQVPVTILLLCTMMSKSNRYKPPVMFTAFACLRHMTFVCESLFTHTSNSVVHVVNSCCDFVTTNAPVLRSSRVPFYLDSLMASAYDCIIDWIVAAPSLLGKAHVVDKIITTVVDGNERIQSFASKTMAPAVRGAAQRLVNMLMKHHAAQSNCFGPMSSRSALFTESSVLSEYLLLPEDTADILSHCHFFAVGKASIVTVVEKPANKIGSAECIVIMRDGTGRYVWRTKPRYRDGARIGSIEEFEKYEEGEENVSDTETDDSRENDESDDEDEDVAGDPLLQALRTTDAKSPLMSWKSRGQGDGQARKRSASRQENPNKVTIGEGNTGISSLIERKAQAADPDIDRERKDVVFEKLLDVQSQEDDLAASERSLSPRHQQQLRCRKPRRDERAGENSWSVARRLMTECGLVSVQNWGAVFAMHGSDDLLKEIEALDQLPDRETFEFAVTYIVSESSEGGYDKMHVVTSADVQSSFHELSSDYENFLSALGEHVGQTDTKVDSLVGTNMDSSRQQRCMLYYSQYSAEALFYVPTMVTRRRARTIDEEAYADRLWKNPLAPLTNANVLIVWSEAQQNYRPGSVLWDTAVGLPLPTSRVVIIIEPLGHDLYCVRISHEGTALFDHEEVITNAEDDCVDEGEVFCARVLGPLQDGTVVNGAWLAPLVRQTALNAASLTRSYERYQYDVGKLSSSPIGPEVNRENAITEMVERHVRPTLPGEFYGGLFSSSPATTVQTSRSSDEGSIHSSYR